VFDGQNHELGAFSFPNLISFYVGNEVISTALNTDAKTFQEQRPMLYYIAGWCVGTPLMRLDLTRYGYVSQSILYYPSGPQVASQYNAVHDGVTCTARTGNLPLASIAQASTAGIPMPLALVK
jgi:hypothetical protein